MSAILTLQVPSSSSQAVHTVQVHDDSSCSCTCAAWRFQKGKTSKERVCRHILKVAETFLAHTDAVG